MYTLKLFECMVEDVFHSFMLLRYFEYLYLFVICKLVTGQPPENISQVATSLGYSNMRSDP